MHYVYFLKSTLKNYYYTGCTKDLKNRLLEHNSGKVRSTNIYAPFELIYYEAGLDERDAFRREKYLKSKRGKIFLKTRLGNWYNLINSINNTMPRHERTLL